MRMSTAGQGLRPSRRKPPHRIIIARGDNVRGFTVRPWVAATLTLTGIVFTCLYVLATGYLVFRDDLLAASLARTARQQQAYEDRIATLRSEIDRLTSRQLLNQEAFEAKLAHLVGKQAALDARQDIIAGLSQAARGAGRGPPAGAAPLPAPEPAAADSGGLPLDRLTTGRLVPAAGERAPLAMAALRAATTGNPLAASSPAARMGAIETSLAALARDQVDYVEDMADKVADRSVRIATVLRKLGQDIPLPAADGEDVGGPFVPLDDNADTETFRTNVGLITDEIERLTALSRTAARLPLAKPIAGAVVTSRYGARLDPFLGRPALHTGIDFKAARGYPARSTAAGTVVSAGYAGGYGKMVEIDHGNGVTTRYAHLSRVLVEVGQAVPLGAILGQAGSTGRSTGPHLHYEIRVDGKAVDPMTYFRAGTELTAIL